MAGERDRKVRKKLIKNQLFAVIDGKESAGDRVIGVAGEGIPCRKREIAPDPAGGGIVRQDVNGSCVDRSRYIAIGSYKIIDGRICPGGRQGMAADRSVGWNDQGDRLRAIRGRTQDRKLIVLDRGLDALTGKGRIVDRRCHRVAGVAAGQRRRIRDIREDTRSDGPLSTIRRTIDFKKEGAGNRSGQRIDLGKIDLPARYSRIGTLARRKIRSKRRIDKPVDSQRRALRSQRMYPQQSIGEGDRDLLAVRADTRDVHHALQQGGPLVAPGRRPWLPIDHGGEIGRRNIAIFNTILFFTGGKNAADKKKEQEYLAFVHV